MQRRNFLAASVAAATSALPAWSLADGLHAASAGNLEAPAVRSAIDIGKLMLREGVIAREADPLLSAFGINDYVGREPASLYQQLAPAVLTSAAADFHAGRTIHLLGWIFSETEARFCALISLAADASNISDLS